MKTIFLWLRFFSLFCLLIGVSTSKIEVLAQKKQPKRIERFNDSRVCKQDLAIAIERVINRPEFARSRWGIEVQTSDGDSLYSLNADKFFTPASSLKLLTTAAALSELGQDYRFTTPVYSLGKPPRLTSLRVKGQGDPSISTKKLKTIVHQLRQLGVKQIDELIIDDSYFEPPAINPTWEWLDVHSYFATAVNSAILNQNTVTLTLLPQKLGEPVKYDWSDAIAARQWQVINQGITGELDLPYNIEIDGDLGKPSLIIRGELAINEPPDVWDLAIVDPAAYFLESLRLYLAQADIEVTKGTISERYEENKLEKELIAIESTDIEEILAAINQDSNNLYAEALGKTLAKELNSETSEKAIAKSLNNLGINPEEYVLLDASGLSRQNLVPPKTLVKTLRLMMDSDNAESYRDSLAVAGVKGTLKRRFTNTELTGKLWGKTGTLTGVGTLSGYLINTSNQSIFFSILINNSELDNREIRQAIDEIITILNYQSKC